MTDTHIDDAFAADVFAKADELRSQMTLAECDFVDSISSMWPDFPHPLAMLDAVCGILVRVELRRPGGAAEPRQQLSSSNLAGSADAPDPSLFRAAMIEADREFGAIAWTVIAYLGLAVALVVVLSVAP